EASPGGGPLVLGAPQGSELGICCSEPMGPQLPPLATHVCMAGVKAHVLDVSDAREAASDPSVAGGLCFHPPPNSSESLMVLRESGDRTTLPGVRCGSSSALFIDDVPFQGLPGSNSATRSPRL
ncbi:unnamed protein product, partial [Ixodes hexagonus]